MDSTETTEEKYLQPEFVADRLAVSRKTIVRMCKEGDIPAVKVRGQWRVRADYSEHLQSPYREKVAV